MFWATFIISGLIVASIPWVASHFSNHIASYMVLIPVMMVLSFTVQFLSNGPKATIEMIQATLWGLPTLFLFGLVVMILLKNNVNLALTIIISLLIWLLSVYVLHIFISK